MFVEIRTTLNTVLPAHREVLKLLHQVGGLEEQELRAQFEAQQQAQKQAEFVAKGEEVKSIFLVKDEVSNAE